MAILKMRDTAAQRGLTKAIGNKTLRNLQPSALKTSIYNTFTAVEAEDDDEEP